METQYAQRRRDDASADVRIAALLTCHNRRESTVEAVERLFAQRGAGVALDVLVLDAGSTDGTADALGRTFDNIEVLRGDASLFWNGGMREVFTRAARTGYDFYLWLNDDTFLDSDALRHLLETHRQIWAANPGVPSLIAGATRDPDSGEISYGGVRRNVRHRPLRFDLVDVTDAPERCETVNGNVVLISCGVVDRIGLLDPAFTHGMGDFDYGLRARAAGCDVWVAPGTVGTCRRWTRPDIRAFGDELRRLRGPKGLPLGEWMTFARRWGGPLWPLYGISPYVRRLAAALVATMRRRAGASR